MSGDTLPVTVSDLEASDPSAACVEETKDILLLKLGKGQKVDLRCVAVKGVGKEHAKWSPVCTAVFHQSPDIKIERIEMEQATEQQKIEIVNSCPQGVFKFDEKFKNMDIEDASKCVFCNECTIKAAQIGVPRAIVIKQKANEFKFTVETTGALPPEDVVQSALAVLQDKLKTLTMSSRGEIELEPSANSH
jgi:DNA-directed RNA polymerase II subunit RPB3